MKSKVFLTVLLAAALSLSAPGLSLARGGMGGGFSGSRGGSDSARQGVGGPAGQNSQQQERNTDQTRQHERSTDQTRQQQRSQSGDQHRNQDGTSATGNTGVRNGAQGSDNGQPQRPAGRELLRPE